MLTICQLGLVDQMGGPEICSNSHEYQGTLALEEASRAGNASNNKPPEFHYFNVTPREGDTDTLFRFEVNVTDPDGDTLSYVLVNLAYDMAFALQRVGNSSMYILEKAINNGKFKVVFETKDARGAKNDTMNHPIDLLVKKYSKEETSYLKYLCISSIIASTLILMFITFRYFRQRRKALAAAEKAPVDASVTCSSCGKPVDEDLNNCPHCGEHFEGEEHICPFCKTSIPEGASRCPLCKKMFRKEPPEGRGRPQCPKCGAVVDRMEGTCPGCDLDLGPRKGLTTDTGKAAEKTGDAYMCSQCGAEAREKDTVCPKCGVSFK